MKITEFVLTKTIGTRPTDWEYFATVTVTTGFWFWKKVERRNVHREFANHWHFVDTGEWCPCTQVEMLARAYDAQDKLSQSYRELARHE